MYDSMCMALLTQWCEKLLSLQVCDKAEDGILGGILCPACSRVHGRSLDALYPFLCMADRTGDEKWVQAAKQLFDWAEQSVSLPDGSYACDTNNAWLGITVFSVTQLCEALKYHGHLLDSKTVIRWKARVRKAADFLMQYQPIYNHNVNYRFANALAMQLAGELFHEKRYLIQAEKCAQQFQLHLTQNGLLFGEGIPPEGTTERGCQAVDIGYNVEESLPSLALYAEMTKNEELARKIAESFVAHLQFMLPDGAWDNSFGTRNFKWTYWGSRTSDGCLLGCLLLAKYQPVLLTAAQQNLQLLNQCTHNSLLYGGLHYNRVGERACVHHTFEHAKVLAGILDRGLSMEGNGGVLPRETLPERVYFPEIDTFILRKKALLATITGYDWEYVKGGHASGGNITMLWHSSTGMILCATMNTYTTHEPNNQQLPRFERHETLSPRLECWENGVQYTSLNDFKSEMHPLEDGTIQISGELVDNLHQRPTKKQTHSSIYQLSKDGLAVCVKLDGDTGSFVCPLVSEEGEQVRVDGTCLTIEKQNAIVELNVNEGHLCLPYGEQRCYNMVAGAQALKTVIFAQNGNICFQLTIRKKEEIAHRNP